MADAIRTFGLVEAELFCLIVPAPAAKEIAMTAKISKSDRAAIRDLATQDTSGEVDDSYARTGDALDTIRRWRSSSSDAGDRELVEIIDRIGEDAAAEIYAAARQ